MKQKITLITDMKFNKSIEAAHKTNELTRSANEIVLAKIH